MSGAVIATAILEGDVPYGKEPDLHCEGKERADAVSHHYPKNSLSFDDFKAIAQVHELGWLSRLLALIDDEIDPFFDAIIKII